MATAAQITANQANARHSTGPRTAEGKAASARNNTSHGLCSKDFVILAGEEQEFSDFMTSLEASIQPVGALELDLFTQLAHASWGLRRCRRAEVASQFHPKCEGGDPLLTFDMADRLKRIDLYARRTERTYQRTLKELQALQVNRLSSEIVDPIEAAIQPPATPPALVNPIHVLRRRAAVARAQEACDAACGQVVISQSLRNIEDEIAYRLDATMNNQTQSAAPATHTAGGAN
ncbi:MAG: hypothetical protein IPP47_34000 [Bryobacterales bacterium]|nr:hypothetical protein [Bryobacterales bacterium]